MPRTLRILVADNDRDGGDTLGELLRLNGYHVHVASSGSHAIEAAARFTPDVVILDLVMPEIDGFTTARELLRHPSSRDAVYIAYSGLTGPEIADRCEKVGFRHLLRKPADPEQFEQLLANIAAARKSAGPLRLQQR